MARETDLDDIPKSGRGDNRRKPTDVLDVYKLPPKKYVQMRLYPGTYIYAGHWINVINKEGKKASFYQPCSAWDSENNTRRGNYGEEHCAWCAHMQWERAQDLDPKERKIRFAQDYYMNAIIRSIERNGPDGGKATKEERKTGFKDKESDSWTPVRPLRMTQNVATLVQDLKQLNTHEDEDGNTKSFKVTDKVYGADIQLKADPDAPSPSQYYMVQLGSQNEIGDKEEAYLKWKLDDLTEYPSKKESAAEYKLWAAKNSPKALKAIMGVSADSGDDDDDDVPTTKKKKVAVEDDDDEPVKPKKKATKSDFDDDDDDEAPAPKPKKKPVVNDDDEDDAPPKKRKPPVDDDEDEAPAPKPKKKPVVVDDDDDDPPPKKKRAQVEDDDEDVPVKPKKKAAVVEDDEDDDPPPKKRKPSVEEEDDDPPPKAKKKARVEDDDDDVPPVKKKKAAVVEDDDDDPPPKKKKRPVDDDDDGL